MPFTEGICNPIQQKLNDVAGNNAPALRRDKVGYIEALQSDANMAGIEKIAVDPGNGKFKQVKITYYLPATTAAVEETCTPGDYCDSGTEYTPLEEIVEVDNCLSIPGLVFNEDEMRKLCEGDAIWVSNIIMGQMNALLVKLDEGALALQGANFGVFAGGGASQDIQLWETGTAQPRTLAVSRIGHQYDLTGASGRPIVIGGGDLDLYMRAIEYAGVNSFGVDVAGFNQQVDYYFDRFAEGQLGAGHFATIAPGAVQLLTWNKYVGEYAKKSDTFEHGTIVDPFTGIAFDLKVHYDDCNDVYRVGLSLNWNVHYIPTNASPGVDLNGTLDFVVCDTITDCPA